VTWSDTRLTRLLGLEVPIVQAPIGGGPSTPALAAAVSNAGGLGSVAGAALAPDDLRAAIRETRAATDRPFAVNLFAPLPPPSTARVAEWAAAVGREPQLPAQPTWSFDDQLAVVADEGVRIFSFTFGIPALDAFDGITIGTATTVAEAAALERAGIDVVLAQGFEAGGHRGTFAGHPEHSLLGTLALVPQVVDAVSIPVVAAGGIMDGRGIAAALALGASGVALGTAFIATDESGATAEHRAALAGETTITRVFTGRHARGARSPVVDELEAMGPEPPDFPLGRSFFPGPIHLLGQGGPLARTMPAGTLVRVLERETDAALADTVGATGDGTGFRLRRLDHVSLNVSDRSRSIGWYRDVLGLELQNDPRADDWPAFMGRFGACIGLFQEPPVGFRHVAFTVGSDDLVRAQSHLTELGVEYRFEDHGNANSIYLRDPDGHTVELTTYDV
jgi:nitronate monooxygenase